MYYIYRITNLVNGKTYIGQHKYKKLDDDYMGSGKILNLAFKKYGIENFKKEILVFNISRKEHIDVLEKTFIASEREKVGKENCYNITDGGGGGSYKGVNKGIKRTEEWKRKQSEVHKGKPTWMKGKHHTEETKKKLSESLKGKSSSWLKGSHRSEESKKKISETLKGRHLSEESRKKISEAHKGVPHSEERKKNIRQARKEMAEAYKESGRKDWNTFQKEYKAKHKEK